jgi:CheY-like chemotaxis protein
VKQSGGEITVFSEAGKGSTFKVYFPCFTRSAEPRALVAKPPESPRGTETILLVEDDSTVRTLAERILKKCGYEVLVACEGAEALTIASDSRTMIDVVVTDFVMPGMNGRQLVEKLLELRPEIASLLMSGYNDDKTLHRGVQDGDTPFLQKPFSPDQLARKVRSVLDRVSP